MVLLTCSYGGCLTQKTTFSSISFFIIPYDERRSLWIQNSGNAALYNIGKKAVRYFCEKHFHPSDIRTQFNRPTLRKSAIPFVYKDQNRTVANTIQYKRDDFKQISPSKQTASRIASDDSNVDNIIKHAYYMAEDSSLLQIDDFEHHDSVVDDDPKSSNESEDDDVYNCFDEQSIHEEEQEEVEEENLAESVNKIVEFYENEFSDEQTVTSSKETETNNLSSKPFEPDSIIVKENLASNDYEEDKHFALSLVGYFQRMSRQKKATAKLRILKFLTDLELSSN